MKNIIQNIKLDTLLAIVVSILAVGCSAADCTKGEGGDVRIAWDHNSYQQLKSIYVENKGYTEDELHYPRIKDLSDGTLLMSFMNDHYGWDALVSRSTDGGVTWSDAQMIRQRYDAISPIGKDRMVFVNPDFIELQDGRILMAYQWRYQKGYSHIPTTNENCGIEICFSSDKGLTWDEPRVIYTGRCWEPAMLELPSGEIQMYITDSNETLNGVSQACTIVIRSFDGGENWQGKPICSWRDGEVISRTIDPRCKGDGMPSGVLLKDGGIAVPLEVWSATYKMDQSPIMVKTDAETNWYSDQSVRANGGPDYPHKKQLNKDFVGYGPYSTILPTGEVIVLSNGTYKNTLGIWTFIGDATADNFKYATNPFSGHWGSIDYVGNNRVIGTGTLTYKDEKGESKGSVLMMTGRLNYSKKIEKGEATMLPIAKFDKNETDYWFLGKVQPSSVFADFAYTADQFTLCGYLFDEDISAYTTENSDAISLLLSRKSGKGAYESYKMVVNAKGNYLLYREENNSWRLIDTGATAVEVAGTINDSSDKDMGYAIKLSLDWQLLGGAPKAGEEFRAHLRHHYKVAPKESPVFALIEGVEGENSDYPQEWLKLSFE